MDDIAGTTKRSGPGQESSVSWRTDRQSLHSPVLSSAPGPHQIKTTYHIPVRNKDYKAPLPEKFLVVRVSPGRLSGKPADWGVRWSPVTVPIRIWRISMCQFTVHSELSTRYKITHSLDLC